MSDPLDLENRKRIFECVRESPGLHFREIQRRMDMPIGVLEYHLDYMTRRELLTVEKHDNFSRYYPRGHLSKEKQRIISSLRQEIPRGIILYLLNNQGATHSEILTNFTISGGTLSYHLKKMAAKEIVRIEKDGRESHVYLIDHDKIADLLIIYRRTFFDKLVDEFVARYVEHGR